MKKVRRAARELALNVLYQSDVCGIPFAEALETAMQFVDLSGLVTKHGDRSEEAREYAKRLAEGVNEKRAELDNWIAELSEGWPIERQPAVDRNILRLAMYEIACVNSVPPVVAVDEAIEMAKKFSTAESGRFINGVLASYLRKYGGVSNQKEEKSESTQRT